MNEALDHFLAEANLDDLAGKSVHISVNEITSWAQGGSGIMKMTMKTGMTSPVDHLHGVEWSNYLRAGLERKLSQKNARCVISNPDVQLVVTSNNRGTQFWAVFVPFYPFFVIDLYQHRTYWAVFDATLDVKSGDGSRVLRTQRINVRSREVTFPTMFAMSLGF